MANRYRIEVGLDQEGKPIYKDLIAGDMQPEGNFIVFRKAVGTNTVVAVYKQFHNAVRTAVNVDDNGNS